MKTTNELETIQTDSPPKVACNQMLYLCAYCCLVITLGFIETFHSAIFVELEHQLQTDAVTIASLFTAKSITFGVSAILCAFVLDSYAETHRFVSLNLCLCALSITVVPWIHYPIPMFIMFIFIGISWGTINVCYPVYIYRAFPNSQQRMLYIAMTIYGISKTVLPLIIQLSITMTGSYRYALYLISSVAMFTALILLILPTPQHDDNRTLKKERGVYNRLGTDSPTTEQESIARYADALNGDKQHIVTQRVLIVLLQLILVSFFATQSGLVNFIVLYCDQYLNIGESMGRFMISGYFGGQLLYRLLVAVMVGDRLKSHWTPSRTLTVGFIGMNLFLVWFVLFDRNVTVIWTVYIGCGFISSAVFPDVVKWGELMTPISGTLSCLFTESEAISDAVMVFVVGELISGPLSVNILPIPVLICGVFGIFVVVISVLLYRSYSVNKEKVITKMQHKVSVSDGVEECLV